MLGAYLSRVWIVLSLDHLFSGCMSYSISTEIPKASEEIARNWDTNTTIADQSDRDRALMSRHHFFQVLPVLTPTVSIQLYSAQEYVANSLGWGTQSLRA
ncbi:hypothetical protein Tco_1033003 [Tanacetum coccineum]|uniref:Uncharacterized protein n=1 Tax=Tanacetum coccineum TaxID=301880 RepID=A0ABQ5GFQ5_9ASTR